MSELPSDVPPLVDGRYRIVAAIGEGGMASVYRAWDTRLRAWRALKVLRPVYASKKALRRRFETEAYAMARLDHPNVVRVYDVGQAGVLPYIAMELVEGGSLDAWVHQNGRMPPRQAIRAVLQVCAGLEAAHARGIIHRDVKPQNVLVDRKGVCKVTDFGIARLEDTDASHTREGASMGTAGFMAPEQRTDAATADARADVFSLGATIFALLTGAERSIDLFAADPGGLEKDGIPAVLVPIVLEASRYRREERYASCAAFAAALEQALPLLPPDPLTVPLELGVAPLPDDHTPPAGTLALPPGIFPASEPTFAPLDPPPRTEPLHKIIPYRMPKVEPRKRAINPMTRSIPAYVDPASIVEEPAGFEVRLAPADGAAKERAQDAPAPTEPVATHAWLRWAVLAVVAGSLAVSLALGGLWLGARPVRIAEARARAAQGAWADAVAEDAPRIRRELVDLGAQGGGMDELIGRLTTASGPSERALAAVRLHGYLRAQSGARRLAVAPADAPRLQAVDARLTDLAHLSEETTRAVTAWEQAADAPAARTAIQLGLASAPD